MPRATTIYLSLGSNVGHRAANLARAIDELARAGVRVVRRSALYETEPVDVRAQPWFLNCVVKAKAQLGPRELLHLLKTIERQMGRKRNVRRGPRVIDLDILFYGSSVIRTRDLKVPHPRMTERRFVLVPLNEIAPGARHPSSHQTVRKLLATTHDRSRIRKLGNRQEGRRTGK